MKRLSVNSSSQLMPRILSVFFHPFLLAPVTFAIIIFSPEGFSNEALLQFIIAITSTVIIPFIFVYLMKNRGKTSGMDIPEREMRFSPFVMGIFSYLIALLLFWLIDAPKVLVILMWAYAFNTAIATVITHYWKISIHGMGVGGPAAALGFSVSGNFYYLLLALPIVIYSRVGVKAHTPMQVVAGFFLGFLLTLIHFNLLMKLWS